MGGWVRWPFQVYYCLHSLFIRSEAAFVVVFNLVEADKAARAGSGSEAREGFLRGLSFWLTSIMTHSHGTDRSACMVLCCEKSGGRMYICVCV